MRFRATVICTIPSVVVIIQVYRMQAEGKQRTKIFLHLLTEIIQKFNEACCSTTLFCHSLFPRGYPPFLKGNIFYIKDCFGLIAEKLQRHQAFIKELITEVQDRFTGNRGKSGKHLINRLIPAKIDLVFCQF
jgi:hypothetical protein